MLNQESSSFNTLERELSIRVDHPDPNYNIHTELFQQQNKTSVQTNTFESQEKNIKMLPPKSKKTKQKLSEQQNNTNLIKNLSTSKSKSSTHPSTHQNNKKLVKNSSNTKSVSIAKHPPLTKFKFKTREFKDFDMYENTKRGQNYNSDQDNDLHFSENTRRKSVPKKIMNTLKMSEKDNMINEIMNTITNETNIRNENSKIMSINSNTIEDIASKVLKASPEYWDNTKRHNLDTAIYTNNPTKIQGRGFGDVESYDIFLNGVGLATRQENPDSKPQNIDEDRIFITNHNYNYDRHDVTEQLPCGSDTRYLNKKII